MIEVNGELSIPEDELIFTASRGGGPGGQHVNKVASRVTIRFDVRGSQSLSERQRETLLERLSSKLTREGVLLMSSHGSRSQSANRQELVNRFTELVRQSLKRPKKRHATRPTRGSKERRLDSKRQRSGVKQTRGRVRRSDDG
jgi:ribosome-associated protein